LGQSFVLLITSRQNEEIQERDKRILEENLESQMGFRESFIQRFGGNDVAQLEGDYSTFYQIVNSKVICRFGRDFGYITHERFISSYDRNGYRMGCHSFEFEPLGRRDPKNKYMPKFTRLAMDRIEEKLFDRLSETVQSQSLRAYYEYVADLPSRVQRDVDVELAGNGDLMNDLSNEANRLVGWLEEK
jgi:hypothetical protein